MKRALIGFTAVLSCLLMLSGCTASTSKTDDGVNEEKQEEVQEEVQEEIHEEVKEESKLDSIPFEDGQYYAAAYLGYQEMDDISYYTEQYLDDDNVPVHYFSDGEYYLIIPRYSDMELTLLKNDMETMTSTEVYEESDCKPFIIQCNVSDIFPDATVRLTYEGNTVEFSPYLSLMDGSVQIGENGLDITMS
ncbi:MAG: hypothetical protein PUD43_08425 [Clostridia bacterium]|nr:hypothetical protein [Clostridia bacterium]